MIIVRDVDVILLVYRIIGLGGCNGDFIGVEGDGVGVRRRGIFVLLFIGDCGLWLFIFIFYG